MNLAIEVNHVSQVFRSGFWLSRRTILSDIQLTIPQHSVFGILGENGAGKTTLIHLMAGIRKPTQGHISIMGYLAGSAEAKLRIGYLPERPYFPEHLSGRELLEYFGFLGKMSRKEVRDRIPVVLNEVGMSHAQNQKLRTYSKGMLQRIGIAQAMIHQPDLLLLDEPMSGLDPVGRKEMRELIIRLGQEGKTILFSSHVIPDVEAICDQVALLQKGRVLASGTLDHLFSKIQVKTEVTFKNISQEDVKHWSEFKALIKIPEGVRGTLSDQISSNQVFKKLISEGAEILSFNPIRPSLEDFFTGKQSL